MLYFRSPWPEAEVPKGEPIWMFWEVDPVHDNVLRTVDVFADGTSIRNSLELEERNGPDVRAREHRSLVSGPFLQDMEAEGQFDWLVETTQAEFMIVWAAATDKPVSLN